MSTDQFLWTPYACMEGCIDLVAYTDSNIWSTCTALICFSIVEWQQTDRVMMQFHLFQQIPAPPNNLSKLHKIDLRGRSDVNWELKHAKWIAYWAERASMTLVGRPIHGPILHSQEYMDWFHTNSLPYIGTNQANAGGSMEWGQSSSQREMPPDPQFTQPSPFSENMYNPDTSHMGFDQLQYIPQMDNYMTIPVDPTSGIETSQTGHDFLNSLFGQHRATPPLPSYHLGPQHDNPANYVTPPNFGLNVHDGSDDEAEDVQPLQCRNPARNRQRPPCGTGHHYGDE